MDPVTMAAIIGGGASLAGGLFSNSASAKQASKQRDFQYYMSNTAYRRAVKDMRRAGLNPVLAAGAPASTPGGAMGQTTNLGQAMSQGVSSAMQYKSVKQGIKATAAQTEKLKAESDYAGTRAEIEKKMWDTIQSNPQMLESFLTGKAGKETGILGGIVGAISGGVNSARKAGGKWLKDRMEPGYEKQSARMYKEMNEKVKRDLEQLRDGKPVIMDIDGRQMRVDPSGKSGVYKIKPFDSHKDWMGKK